MNLSEAEITAIIATLANEIGLKSNETINVTVSGGDDSFSAQYGHNGLESFAYGNSSAKILSQDVIIMDAIKWFIFGSVAIIALNLIFRHRS